MGALETLQSLLTGNFPVALLASFFAGLLTSFSPCVIAMSPVVLGYVGAYGGNNKLRNLQLVVFLVVGLAVAFAILGLIAALIGGIFGQLSDVAPLVLGVVLIIVGLNLMKLVTIPALGLKKWPVRVSGRGGAFLTGLFFGVAASPCATGFLAVIISLAAVSDRPLQSAALLFAYGLGHGVPLIIVGLTAGTIKSLRQFSQYWDYFSYVAGLLFVGVGVYLFALWL